MIHYILRGGVEKRPKRIPITQMIWSWIGTMFGIGIVAAVHYRYIAHKDLVFVIGKISI